MRVPCPTNFAAKAEFDAVGTTDALQASPDGVDSFLAILHRYSLRPRDPVYRITGVQVIRKKCKDEFVCRAARVCFLVKRNGLVQRLVANIALRLVSTDVCCCNKISTHPRTDCVKIHLDVERSHFC